jgi:molecular chaperone DnaK
MLQIDATNLRRSLPLGSQIDVTLHMDASRLLTVRAYVPLLDEEFPATIQLGGKMRRPDPAQLRQELAEEAARLERLRARRDIAPATLVEKVDALVNSALGERLELALHCDAADFDALLRAERDLVEFKVRLDELATDLEWPEAVHEAERWMDELSTLVEQRGTPADRPRARALNDQTRGLIADKNRERLVRKTAELIAAYSEILYRHPDAWADQLELLARRVGTMRDPAKGRTLIEAGRSAVATSQLEQVKEVVFQLQDLLPGPSSGDQARVGYGSTLVT